MKIRLSGKNSNKFVIIDDEDYDKINKWKWYLHKGYAFHRHTFSPQKSKLVGMHRIIMNLPKNLEIDHINGNKLDNRKSNLRLVTHRENMQNMKKRTNSTSNFRGVHWYKNAWNCQLWYNNKNYYLGRFKSEIEAAKYYNNFVKNKLNGDKILNSL